MPDVPDDTNDGSPRVAACLANLLAERPVENNAKSALVHRVCGEKQNGPPKIRIEHAWMSDEQ